jgi:ribose 5-phosphate isomerase
MAKVLDVCEFDDQLSRLVLQTLQLVVDEGVVAKKVEFYLAIELEHQRFGSTFLELDRQTGPKRGKHYARNSANVVNNHGQVIADLDVKVWSNTAPRTCEFLVLVATAAAQLLIRKGLPTTEEDE